MDEEKLTQIILERCKWFDYRHNIGFPKSYTVKATILNGQYDLIGTVSFKDFNHDVPFEQAVSQALARSILREQKKLKTIGITMTLEDIGV